MKMRPQILSLCSLLLFIGIGYAAPVPLPDKEVCEIAQPMDALLLCNEAPEVLMIITPISDGHYITEPTMLDDSILLHADFLEYSYDLRDPYIDTGEARNVESILARYPTNDERRPAKKWVRCSP